MRRVTPFDARGYYYYYGPAAGNRRQTAALGGAFSPLAFGPFGFWLPEPQYLFQEEDGTGAVTADGTAVGYMADLSGNGRHLVQATASSRPLYKTSGGLHWLEFDGSDDHLKAVTFNLEHPFDRYMAARWIAQASNATLWDGNSATLSMIFCQDPGDLRAFNGAALQLSNDPADDADFVISEQWNTATSRFAIDNNSYTSGNVGANPDSPDGFTLGARGDGSNPANMRFYGGVAFSSAQADADIALLRTYLAAKQGRVL